MGFLQGDRFCYQLVSFNCYSCTSYKLTFPGEYSNNRSKQKTTNFFHILNDSSIAFIFSVYSSPSEMSFTIDIVLQNLKIPTRISKLCWLLTSGRQQYTHFHRSEDSYNLHRIAYCISITYRLEPYSPYLQWKEI